MSELKPTTEESIRHFETQQKRYVREHNGKLCPHYANAIEALRRAQPAGRERRGGMSCNTQKIVKALAGKGYQPREIFWEPIGHACEMFGPDGGWYISVETLSADEDGEHDYVDTILAYSTEKALEEIERLPMAALTLKEMADEIKEAT